MKWYTPVVAEKVTGAVEPVRGAQDMTSSAYILLTPRPSRRKEEEASAVVV